MEATTKSLEDWLNWIIIQHQTHKPSGFYRTYRIARELELLRVAKTIIVVGGTNGKGSTVHYLENLCIAGKVSVGVTTSPHLERFNERIRINGEEISDEIIVDAFTVIRRVQASVNLTFHEYVTLAALFVFKKAEVDCAVLEVGLGGRLDATNVSERDVNVITSIGTDHQDRLGSDRESIGFEKAGILRRRIPLIYGDSDPVSSVEARAYTLNCPVFHLQDSIKYTGFEQIPWNFELNHPDEQYTIHIDEPPNFPESASLALGAAKLAGLDINPRHCRSLDKFQLAGRCELFQFQQRTWIVDVGHNPSATSFLIRFVKKKQLGNLAFAIIGVLRDKALRDIISTTNLPNDQIVIVETQGHRGLRIEQLAKLKELQRFKLSHTLGEAIDFVLQNTEAEDLIAVFGSFDLVQRMRTTILAAKDG
ncbi:MAG: hypothetical protein F4039_02670 [Gammaproteobacteria bacterium]|nr:hypothetical protein [Gammaproteobacteria bacterium]MYF53309.1 hypothetical protein [Gammaproteobacteria bacterium]MYK42979.1 hypothetical protein [Gammaproteobacteria bacterium]